MENFKIYENMDSMNVEVLTKGAGAKTWPKGKRYMVNCNGVEIKIQTFYTKMDEKLPRGGYDAYAAIDSIYRRELRPDEIRWETDGEPQYSEPMFNKDAIRDKRLSEEQVKERLAFITAVANLINNQEAMEAIVQAATKKKNGTLHKGRVLKIASSGIAGIFTDVSALVARNKDDKTIAITFEDVNCKEGDNALWANDFVSTPHEGLKLSELIAESLS